VCVRLTLIPPSCISVNVNNFLRSLYCCYGLGLSGLPVGYQCLALEPDALLTYVVIVIITTSTRDVVMPNSQSTPMSTEADLSRSKYIKTGERSQRGAQDGSGTQDCR